MVQQLYDTSAGYLYESVIDNYKIIIRYNGLINHNKLKIN